MKAARILAFWKRLPQRGIVLVALLMTGIFAVAQEPPLPLPTLFGPSNKSKAEQAADDELIRIYRKEERRITILQATRFHQLFLAKCTDQLPEPVKIQYAGPLVGRSQRRGLVMHGPPASVLTWNVYDSFVFFSIWISTVHTEETVVTCKVDDVDIFVNVSFVVGHRSIDEKMKELGGQSVREVLSALAVEKKDEDQEEEG